MSATMTLAQLLAGGAQGTNPLTHIFAREFVTRDQFTGLIPAHSVPGTKNIFRRELSRPTAGIYDVDQSISQTAGKTVKVTEEVGRIYCVPQLDNKVTLGHDLRPAFMEQLKLASWQLSDVAAENLARGAEQTTSSDGNIKGLKAIVDASAFPATQEYDRNASTAGGYLRLIDLDILKAKVRYRPDFYVMPTRIAIDYKALVQALGGGIEQVEMPFAKFGSAGYEIDTRLVASYDGVPIFVNDNITAETYCTGGDKYRVYCGTFEPDKGLELFYPEGTDVGMTIGALTASETKLVKFIQMEMFFNLSLRSYGGLAVLRNLRSQNVASSAVL
jgi:hypothetical protein